MASRIRCLVLRRTQTVKNQIAAGQFAASQGSWNDLLAFIDTKSGSVVSADRR